MIKIDETKCKKDGLCVAECPAVILKQADKESLPVMVPGGEKACLVCGHCVAVCPHDAFHHGQIPMEASPAILKDLSISREQAVQFVRSRRSIRRFKDKPVEKDTIASLIENARYAPTGGNSQLIKWTVFNDSKQIDTLSEMTIDWMRMAVKADTKKRLPPYFPLVIAAYDAGMKSISHGAPCLVFASAPGIYDNGMVDLSIALSYFELIAVSSGLGTCWLGLITRALQFHDPLKEAVGLPEGHTHFYAMVLGHPKFKYHRVPERKSPKIFWK